MLMDMKLPNYFSYIFLNLKLDYLSDIFLEVKLQDYFNYIFLNLKL